MSRCSMVVVGISLLLAFAPLAGEAVVGSQEDVAAINKVREMEATSVNSLNLETITSIYAHDVEYLPPGEPALKGTDAVQEWVAAMVEQFDVDLKYTAAEVEVIGDWAFEQYAGTATLAPKAGGDSVVEHVRGIHIYRRGEDGSWKITHDIWNSDAPMPAME